jgi:DNA-binding MarR family transcriptional regulator
MDKVSVSRAVRNLMDKGFLQRRTDTSDRRRLWLYVTRGQGKQVLESIVPLAAAYEIELLKSLDDQELATLDSLLGKLQKSAVELRTRLNPTRFQS